MNESSSETTGVDWDYAADVVVVGTGAAGLPAAVMARDQGAAVIAIDENHDVGGHAMLSGGRLPLGGGTSYQKKYGIEDSVDQVFLDHTTFLTPQAKYSDRDLVSVWAEENVPTFEFLVENGVRFNDTPPIVAPDETVPRLAVIRRFSDNHKWQKWLRPCQAFGGQCPEKRGAVPFGPQDDEHYQNEPHFRQSAWDQSGVPGKRREHSGETRGHPGHRRSHQQCGIPQDVRSTADRRVSGRW